MERKILPALKADLENVLNVLDDVICVDFDTWLYNEKEKYAIEFNRDGMIMMEFI